jgi:predicted dehydrogenase
MSKHRVALIGCGSVSQRGVLPHLACEDARARLELVAVVDNVAERAKATADKYNVPHWYDDVDSMLRGCDADMVLVITPIQLHYEQALKAVQAGRHVYVQKTMTTTLAEADALLTARDAAGVRLVAAPGYDLHPLTLKMRQAVQSGALGHVAAGYTFAMGFGHEYESIREGEGALNSIDPGWYYRKGAGPLPDVTVYSLALATSVLGPVREVTMMSNTLIPKREWRGKAIEIDVADNNLLLMKFASGALLTGIGADVGGSSKYPWGGMMLLGTHGALEVVETDGATGYATGALLRGSGGGWGTFSSGQATELLQIPVSAQPYMTGPHLDLEEGHLYVDIMELADAIDQDRPTRASGEQARHIVEIIEKGHIAAETGQTQVLSSTFTFA